MAAVRRVATDGSHEGTLHPHVRGVCMSVVLSGADDDAAAAFDGLVAELPRRVFAEDVDRLFKTGVFLISSVRIVFVVIA